MSNVEEVPQNWIPISYITHFIGTSSTSASEMESAAAEMETTSNSQHSPHSHNLTLGAVSLRVWELDYTRMHDIRSV